MSFSPDADEAGDGRAGAENPVGDRHSGHKEALKQTLWKPSINHLRANVAFSFAR
jgi:hypothetical protein